jgi:FkbM family methyltransferase
LPDADSIESPGNRHPALTVLAITPQVGLAGLAVLGRANQCSFSQSVASFGVAKDRLALSQALQSSSQLLQSDDAHELWHTRDGDFWIPKHNQGTLFHELAEQEQDIYGSSGTAGVHSGDTVLDCGANIGVYTRKALNAGARQVIAIEPGPENVACLRRSFAKEIATGRVSIQPVGVWNEAGTLPLNVDADSSSRDRLFPTAGPAGLFVMVPLVTIDSLAASLALERVDVIKMDIEGAERPAIAGASRTLARFHPRLAIAMEHLPDDPVAIPAAIRSLGLGYATICGPCLDNKFDVRPDVLYFVAR